jgi:uncharacterized protein (TIGR02271 family)
MNINQQASQSGEAPSNLVAGGTGGEATVIRSEEQLRIDVEVVPSGRARLLKRVVTEDVTVTVPVSREVVTLERLPISDADDAQAVQGAELTAHTWELVLYTERLVVTKEIVPIERIRMSTQVVTEEQDVTQALRKEHVQAERREPR